MAKDRMSFFNKATANVANDKKEEVKTKPQFALAKDMREIHPDFCDYYDRNSSFLWGQVGEFLAFETCTDRTFRSPTGYRLLDPYQPVYNGNTRHLAHETKDPLFFVNLERGNALLAATVCPLTVKIWDTESNRLLKTIPLFEGGENAFVGTVQLLADGIHLIGKMIRKSDLQIHPSLKASYAQYWDHIWSLNIETNKRTTLRVPKYDSMCTLPAPVGKPQNCLAIKTNDNIHIYEVRHIERNKKSDDEEELEPVYEEELKFVTTIQCKSTGLIKPSPCGKYWILHQEYNKTNDYILYQVDENYKLTQRAILSNLRCPVWFANHIIGISDKKLLVVNPQTLGKELFIEASCYSLTVLNYKLLAEFTSRPIELFQDELKYDMNSYDKVIDEATLLIQPLRRIIIDYLDQSNSYTHTKQLLFSKEKISEPNISDVLPEQLKKDEDLTPLEHLYIDSKCGKKQNF